MIDNRTLGQKLADIITKFSGSWSFIIVFSIVCASWISLNLLSIFVFDKAPYLLLNLGLGLIAAIQGPLILLSQNRQNDHDRENIARIIEKLDNIQEKLNKL
jgi:uncharacterized membrane protein